MSLDKKAKRKKILWIIAGISGILGILMVIIAINFSSTIGVIGIIFSLFSFIILLINLKYYYSIPIFVGIVIIAIFLKSIHCIGASILLLFSIWSLSVISIISSFKHLKNKNLFLKWIGFFANIILPIMNFAYLFRFDYSRFGDSPYGIIMTYIGAFSLVLLILAMIFTLPNSKYLEWTKIDKKSFYLSIIVPMLFIFSLTALDFLANDTFQHIIGKNNTYNIYYNMKDVKLIPHEGLNLD